MLFIFGKGSQFIWPTEVVFRAIYDMFVLMDCYYWHVIIKWIFEWDWRSNFLEKCENSYFECRIIAELLKISRKNSLNLKIQWSLNKKYQKLTPKNQLIKPQSWQIAQTQRSLSISIVPAIKNLSTNSKSFILFQLKKLDQNENCWYRLPEIHLHHQKNRNLSLFDDDIVSNRKLVKNNFFFSKNN